MGFFKDFKNDMKKAVNELIPDNEEMTPEYDDDDMVNTLEEPKDSASDSSQQASTETAGNASDANAGKPGVPDLNMDETDFEAFDDIEIDEEDLSDDPQELQSGIEADMDSLADLLSGKTNTIDIRVGEDEKKQEESVFLSEVAANIPEENTPESVLAETAGEIKMEDTGASGQEAFNKLDAELTDDAEVKKLEEELLSSEDQKDVQEDTAAAENKEENDMASDKIIDIASIKETEEDEQMDTPSETAQQEIPSEEVSDTTTYIAKGTRIEGNLFTDGSIDVLGSIEGDVNCYGKLVISGSISGKVNAGEIYANAAKIEGEIASAGSVKVGVGSVIVGNIDAQSAVIAGAVNGDLDVKGPVIVDSTAVIMGNIKSRSVQINNGAVIEGFCSQCYSDIDVKSFFA